MSRRSKSSFNVDSILDNGDRIELPNTSDHRYRTSPCQEQNFMIPQVYSSANFDGRSSSKWTDSTRGYEIGLGAHSNLTGPSQFGLGLTQDMIRFGTISSGLIGQQENSNSLMMSPYQQPSHTTHPREMFDPKQFQPPHMPAIGGTTLNTPPGCSRASEIGPIMPSMAALATYSMFNWCAKCSCSFRMTSDLVHHRRTQHKRRRTGID